MFLRRRHATAVRGEEGDTAIEPGSSRSSSEDGVSDFLTLILLAVFYSVLLWIASRCVRNGYRQPLPVLAPLDKFSEARAMQHVWQLAHEIGGRQEGTEGLLQAAEYIKSEIQQLIAKSKSVRLELDESFVSGSFNMHFLQHNVAFAYRNHTNIAVRVSGVADDKPAVLVSGHFDSPLGSAGAGDCASCVASMLEVLRYIVDTNWTPPTPIIFLFNGAEEVFLLASHGFITTHRWRSSIGAVINVEATGASGPDLVVQSGPETWPTRVYADSAVVPGANSVAQDVFPFVPGDTDYRIFSHDFADIPGLDTVFILNGYVYHTPQDRPENIAPGSIQTRGENLIGLLKGFTGSIELKTASQRALSGGSDTERHVFFDFLGFFMVHYSRKTALFLHAIPLLITLLAPQFSSGSLTPAYLAILEGGVIHAVGCLLAIICPIVLAILTQSFSNTAMIWFARPWLAAAMFVPAAVTGLLLPHVVWVPKFNLKSTQDARIWASHWGAIGFYGLAALILTSCGAMSGYFSCWWALFMAPALFCFRWFQMKFGQQSIRSLFGYILPAFIPSAYSIFFVYVFAHFIAEKLGMVGGHPDPIGFYVGDVVMAATIGLAVVATLAHIIPGLAHILGKPRVIWLLLTLSFSFSILFSGTFPYSDTAPKRIILQHTFRTSGDTFNEATYEFATVDPNSMTFVLKHAPLVREAFDADIKLSKHDAPNTFLALYPISLMLSRSYSVLSEAGPPYQGKPSLPKLRQVGMETHVHGKTHISLELDLGSLQEVWAAAINFTGPLTNWSLANHELPGAEVVNGGPKSYTCRFTGKLHSEGNWRFWVEKNGSEPLRAELGVLDQRLGPRTLELMSKFPSWAAVVAGTTYISSYVF